MDLRNNQLTQVSNCLWNGWLVLVNVRLNMA